MLPALALALGVTVAEVAVLLVIAKKPKRRDPAVGENLESPFESSKAVAGAEEEFVYFAAHGRNWSTIERHVLEYRILKASASAARVRARPRASQVTLWMTADVAKRAAELHAKRTAAQRRVAVLPDHWHVTPQGEQSFTIDAGAFEIEHFGGQTNIRIHDPSRVTVEGSERGMPVVGASREIKTSRYN
jgi:hypothetical protein